MDGRSGWTLARISGVLALVLLFVWVFTTSFRPVANNDFWLHLRIGEDILESGQVPETDAYSAVAAGRPFFAHAWLSAISFALLDRLGPLAVTLIRTLVALGIVGLLWFAVPARARRGAFALPLCILAMYVIALRFSVRPHLFSLLAFAALIFILERWRSSRRVRVLYGLPLLFLLWANLHGGFLSGLGILGLFTGVVMAQARWGARRARGGDELFTPEQARGLAITAVLCGLATLANPLGVQLLLFPITMAEGNAFLKEFIREWGSPFGAEFRASSPYVLWAFCAFMLATWGAVLATWKQRRWLDLVLLAAVTVISVRANRFLPYAPLLGFPIAVRAWGELATRRFPGLRRQSWLELSALGGLIFLALKFGFAHGPQSRRPMGWGYGGNIPYEGVARIKELGLSGVVFNELADGSILIHELSPEVKPVMDARVDVYGRDLYLEYRDSRAGGPEALMAYFQKYGVEFVFLRVDLPDRQLIAQFLDRHPFWERRFTTSTHFLFTRRDQAVPR